MGVRVIFRKGAPQDSPAVAGKEKCMTMKRQLVFAFIAALVIAVLPVTSGTSAAAMRACNTVHFEGNIPWPKAGEAGLAEAVINDDCSLTYYPVRTILSSDAARREQNADGQPQNSGRQIRRQFAPIRSNVEHGPDPDYHINNQIIDPWGTNLTQIVTDLSATTNGSTITSYNAGGYQQYHGEIPDPTCNNGPGWYPLSGNGLFDWSGGNGQTWVAVHSQGWFGYRGQFDCSGSTYENHLDNWVYVYGDNSTLCSYSQWWKTGFPGWHLYVTCWNPFAVKVDRTL